MGDQLGSVVGATAEGTLRHKDRMVDAGCAPGRFRPLGRTGLTVSGVGFGGYRVHNSVEDHRAALGHALMSGCNLIDTSTNYGDGASEELVAQVMAEPAFVDRRDEIVVVSKVGYVQGQNLRLAQHRETSGEPYPEMVKYADGCWHCIHPRFIDEQVDRSLERTGLGRVDVYLLHNPEYFLSDRAKRQPDLDLEGARQAFYGRVARAFECLERLVREGKIGWYGVSSNTLGAPPQQRDGTSLSRLIEAARLGAGEANHFAVVQCPINLLELGPALVPNSGPDGSATVLETASSANLGLLANRPLNALVRGRLIRLSDFEAAGEEAGRPRRLVKQVQRLESEFSEGLGAALEFSGDDGEELFKYAARLREVATSLDDIARWDEYVQHAFSPEISEIVSQIDTALDGPMKAAWQIWLERYVDALSRLVAGLRVMCARASQRRSDRVSRALAPAIPELYRDSGLSRKAIGTLLGLPGVTSVLVGMRNTGYVADAAGVLSWPPFEVRPETLQHIAREAAS